MFIRCDVIGLQITANLVCFIVIHTRARVKLLPTYSHFALHQH
nr:MAG TPA: hypothetical protein [Caudoviricetes sp.]